ncbi:MAG: DinB family protein [Ktedonobacterales bacterium]
MALSHAQLVATLQQTSPTLRRLTSTLADRALDFRSAPDEWSIREILAHLVDDEIYVMRIRLERIVKEDRPSLAPHDEKGWYASRNTTRDQLAELLGDFDLQRAASLGVITMLRESDWARTGHQPEYGDFTADEWLTHWVTHDTTHLRQIESILEVYQTQSADK